MLRARLREVPKIEGTKSRALPDELFDGTTSAALTPGIENALLTKQTVTAKSTSGTDNKYGVKAECLP